MREELGTVHGALFEEALNQEPQRTALGTVPRFFENRKSSPSRNLASRQLRHHRL